MAQQLVTLEHPDGRRRHRTDNPSEVNMLVGTYGYRRVDEDTSSEASQTSRSSKHQRSTRSPATSEESPQTSPNVPSTGTGSDAANS